MQIHELNTLDRLPKPTDYLAIDTGFDTAKIPANALFADGDTVAQAITDWLNDHPEATTTVQDGSLTKDKFTPTLKLETIKEYVTPEMFGAVGDGTTDDSSAIQDALDSGKMVFLSDKNYKVNSTITMPQGGVLIGSGEKHSFLLGAGVILSATNQCLIKGIGFQGSSGSYVIGSSYSAIGVQFKNSAVGRNAQIISCSFKYVKAAVAFENNTQCLDVILDKLNINFCENGINGGTWGLRLTNSTISGATNALLNLIKSGYISNCKMWSSKKYGIYLNGFNWMIDNVGIDGCQYLFYLPSSSHQNYITSLNLSSGAEYALVCEGYDNYVRGEIVRFDTTGYDDPDIAALCSLGGVYLKGDRPINNNINMLHIFGGDVLKAVIDTGEKLYPIYKTDYPNLPNNVIINGVEAEEKNPLTGTIYSRGNTTVSNGVVTGSLTANDYTPVPNILATYVNGFSVSNISQQSQTAKWGIIIECGNIPDNVIVCAQFTNGVTSDAQNTYLQSGVNAPSMFFQPGAKQVGVMFIETQAPCARINISAGVVPLVAGSYNFNITVSAKVFPIY